MLIRNLPVLIFFIASLSAMAAFGAEYRRVETQCEISLTREDIDHPPFKLESFKVISRGTYEVDDPDKLLRRSFEIIPPAQQNDDWAKLLPRIRAELENFTWNRYQFKFAFGLNYDGIYTLIRALGGTDLEFTDDLHVAGDVTIDEAHRYQFAMTPRNGFRVQAHLLPEMKNGLSFHFSGYCK